MNESNCTNEFYINFISYFECYFIRCGFMNNLTISRRDLQSIFYGGIIIFIFLLLCIITFIIHLKINQNIYFLLIFEKKQKKIFGFYHSLYK